MKPQHTDVYYIKKKICYFVKDGSVFSNPLSNTCRYTLYLACTFPLFRNEGKGLHIFRIPNPVGIHGYQFQANRIFQDLTFMQARSVSLLNGMDGICDDLGLLEKTSKNYSSMIFTTKFLENLSCIKQPCCCFRFLKTKLVTTPDPFRIFFIQ